METPNPPPNTGGDATDANPAPSSTHEDVDESIKDSIIGMDFRKLPDKRTAKIHRSLITKAYLPDRHLAHVSDFYRSEKLPIGAVSRVLYNDLFNARKFDRYGRLVPNKMTEKEKMIAELQKTFASQADAEGTKGEEAKKQQVPDLQTPLWKIGYKKVSGSGSGSEQKQKQKQWQIANSK